MHYIISKRSKLVALSIFFFGVHMTVPYNANATEKLPDYVVLESLQDKNSGLRTASHEIKFPLNAADNIDINTLSAKFDSEDNCAGLAAPQIGIQKKIIVFAAPETPELKKWRPDFTDSMPKTIWINPTYSGQEDHGYHEDYEACFSVNGYAGIVKRFKKIKYSAYNTEGKYITGTAEGFIARIIQHEIDHLNGILFIDKVEPGKLMTMEEYRKKRQAALQDLTIE